MRKEDFVRLALRLKGKPCGRYVDPNRGVSPNDFFDCSGFVKYVLELAHYPGSVPRHCNEIFDHFGVTIHEGHVQPGDLIFFSRKRCHVPGHMGIMISNDEYIHSPGNPRTKVRITRVERTAIKPVLDQTLLYTSNPIGYKRVTVPNGRYQSFFLS